MSDIPKLPSGATEKNGLVHDAQGNTMEIFEGKWCVVKNHGRLGWWRYHEHYDRDGYCDNPARGY